MAELDHVLALLRTEADLEAGDGTVISAETAQPPRRTIEDFEALAEEARSVGHPTQLENQRRYGLIVFSCGARAASDRAGGSDELASPRFRPGGIGVDQRRCEIRDVDGEQRLRGEHQWCEERECGCRPWSAGDQRTC